MWHDKRQENRRSIEEDAPRDEEGLEVAGQHVVAVEGHADEQPPRHPLAGARVAYGEQLAHATLNPRERAVRTGTVE